MLLGKIGYDIAKNALLYCSIPNIGRAVGYGAGFGIVVHGSFALAVTGCVVGSACGLYATLLSDDPYAKKSSRPLDASKDASNVASFHSRSFNSDLESRLRNR